jgi:two-component system sensor histidine kinase PilS (NtrC family)
MLGQNGIEVQKRLYWIAAARAGLCLFAAAVVSLNVPSAASLSQALPYLVAAAGFGLNGLILALVRARVRWRIPAAAGSVLDLLLITALVAATGGPSSDFRLLYFGPILASSVLFRRAGALITASFSTIGLLAGAFCYVAYAGRPPYVDPAWLGRETVWNAALVAPLALQAAAFHLVAYLSSTLTMRLTTASIDTEQILENMSDGLVTVARDARVVYANARAGRLLALPAGAPLTGASLADVAPADVSRAFVEVMSSMQPSCVDATLGPKCLPAQVTVLPLLDSAGRLRGANVVLHDLTERRRLNEALRRAERLEATAATVASIAHEIRNPLAAIRGSAQELKRVSGLSDCDLRLIDLVVRESDRLNRVLTEFLNFSRMPKPQFTRFDLRALLDDVAAQLRFGSSGKAALSVTGPGRVALEGDPEQLRQVFVNLGLNALDATGGEGPVEFVLAEGDGDVVVFTRDRGCGIPPDLRDKVFEPFFTTRTTGTGLGLPIARQIIEEHFGAISVDDCADGWTSIKVLLPSAERQRLCREETRVMAASPAARA